MKRILTKSCLYRLLADYVNGKPVEETALSAACDEFAAKLLELALEQTPIIEQIRRLHYAKTEFEALQKAITGRAGKKSALRFLFLPCLIPNKRRNLSDPATAALP